MAKRLKELPIIYAVQFDREKQAEMRVMDIAEITAMDINYAEGILLFVLSVASTDIRCINYG